MAKKKPMNQFKPGECGNPNGRPPLPEHVRKIKALNSKLFVEIANEYLFLTPNQLDHLIERDDLPAINVAMARFISQCAANGSFYDLNRLLDRLVGPVKQVAEVSTMKPFIYRDLDGGQIVMGYKEQEEEED